MKIFGEQSTDISGAEQRGTILRSNASPRLPGMALTPLLTWVLWIITGVTTLFAQENILGTEAQREKGKKIYDAKCAQCHGDNGDARSVARDYFRPQPRDFTSATFKFRSTQSGQLPTHEDIKRSIKNGMPYTGMPAWPSFSGSDLDNLAFYIKTFAKEDFVDYAVDAVPIKIPDPPPMTEESIQRGRIVFEENQCIDCHGNLGRGDGPSAPTLKDQWDQPIRPADLTKPWTFRSGGTRKDIYKIFTTGLDGSPMPSYNIQPPEDQWALVDYVYSLRRSDEPHYAVAVIARPYGGEIDLSEGRALFAGTTASLFPVAGQVIEPGRAFYPGVNAIEVNAVYNADDIALMLTWHDMSAEREGKNSPALNVPLFEEQQHMPQGWQGQTGAETFSDAVAVLLPSENIAGAEKPYFLFGDSKHPMDIWFADLAKQEAEFFVGRGSQKIEAANESLEVFSAYEEGRWTVIFKRSRVKEGGLSFAEGQWVPIAFSVWDGFNRERGNKRGLTSWYHIYLEPADRPSPLVPILQYAGLTFLLLAGVVAMVRLKYRDQA